MEALKFSDPAVQTVFEGYPSAERERLLALRQLIFDVATATEGVGPLTETLKWGQPAYLTEKTKSGSTVRLGTTKNPGETAVYFICHTGLVSQFKDVLPDALPYEGTRAIVFGADDQVDEDELAQCLAMALTFKKKTFCTLR